jgi:hypothetical protein
MVRSRRSFAWSLVLALLCASFVAAQQSPTVAHAATQTLYVNTATDPYPAPAGSCAFLADPDTDLCSLRTAILKANSAAASDTFTIQFQIPQNYPGYLNEMVGPFQVQTWTIRLTQPLDFVTHDSVSIDGFSQAQFIGQNPNPFGPEIIVDGSLQTQTGGLTFQSSNNTVKGLGIINFQTTGGFVGVGIEFRSLGGNLGIGNKVQGCFIGIDRLGVNPAPNTIGIWLRTDNNLVGGDSTKSDEYNIISGNINDGILIEGSSNSVQGNVIGLNSTGQNAVGNHGNGVTVRIANGNLIGAPTNAINSIYRNVISGNYQQGIQVFNGQNNQIYGNLVGVDVAGAAAIPNRGDGVLINSSGGQTKNNIVGGPNFFNRNTISGNGGVGVHIQGDNTSNNQVFNNLIGPASGGLAIPTGTFTQTGVVIDQGADGNQVGGSAALQPNVISGNKGDGIHVAGFLFAGPPATVVQSNDNKIIGNLIGLNRLGLAPLPNNGNGISLATYVNRTTIGGTTVADRNQILFNQGHGISISSSPVVTTTILKNTIQSNTGNGIFVSGARATVIDGGDAANANLITSNGANGIKVTDSVTTTIQFNTIRLNAQNGVQVSGVGNAFTYIKSNILNVNSQNGVQVDGQALKTEITSSTIYSNTLNGVLVRDAGTFGTQRVKIFDNSMQGNAAAGNKKGIVLTPSTAYPGGGVTNPNHDIDRPYSLQIDQTGNLSGKVRITPNNPAIAACAQPCVIQIFTTNPQTLDTQGRDKVNATVTIVPDTTDPSIGNFSALVGKVPPQLALTATDKDGNTSEFAVFTSTFGLDIEPPRFGSAFPGQVITYTHRITNTGTVDFTNIKYTAFSKLGWPFKLAPIGDITLAGGASKPVTLTLTLPTGSDPRVRAGLVELTRLTVSATTTNPALVTTDSVTDTTTVGGKFILDASFKLGRKGNGTPGTLIDYTRMLTNTGNITGTVTLTATTDLGWTTTITPTSVQLPPGKAIGVTSSVSIPLGATAGTVGKTTLTFNGTPDAQRLVITDTTTVLLTPKATMVFNQQAQGNAGKTVQFCHTVTNLSNGSATFSLTGVSSLGSKITFISDTPGRQLVNGHTFTVGITNADKSFNFCANVVIDPFAFKGQQDLVAIGLIDTQGAVVGGASVRDLIDVVGGLVLPRLHMPLIRR